MMLALTAFQIFQAWLSTQLSEQFYSKKKILLSAEKSLGTQFHPSPDEDLDDPQVSNTDCLK